MRISIRRHIGDLQPLPLLHIHRKCKIKAIHVIILRVNNIFSCLTPLIANFHIRLHAFTVKRVTFAETVNPKTSFHIFVAFNLKVEPLTQSMRVGVFPIKDPILFLWYSYHCSCIAAFKFRIKLQLIAWKTCGYIWQYFFFIFLKF